MSADGIVIVLAVVLVGGIGLCILFAAVALLLVVVRGARTGRGVELTAVEEPAPATEREQRG